MSEGLQVGCRSIFLANGSAVQALQALAAPFGRRPTYVLKFICSGGQHERRGQWRRLHQACQGARSKRDPRRGPACATPAAV